MESDTEYFTADFHKNLLYDYQLFDIAKLLDIAAIYGASNSQIVSRMIENLFEQEPRYALDFKDCFSMMINMFKRIFKDALRTDQMMHGDTFLQKSKSEQDDIIILLLNDTVEILSNFKLVVQHFGSTVLDQVSQTNFMVLLTNAYCMSKKIKKHWIARCQSKEIQQRA